MVFIHIHFNKLNNLTHWHWKTITCGYLLKASFLNRSACEPFPVRFLFHWDYFIAFSIETDLDCMVLHKGKTSVKGFFCKLLRKASNNAGGKHHKNAFLFTVYKRTTISHRGEERQGMLPQIRRIFLFRKRGHLVNLWAMLVGKLLTKTKLWTYVRTLWPWDKNKINRCCVIVSVDSFRQCILWRDFSLAVICFLSSSEQICNKQKNQQIGDILWRLCILWKLLYNVYSCTLHFCLV